MFQFSGDQLNSTVTGLVPYTTYAFTVEACTVVGCTMSGQSKAVLTFSAGKMLIACIPYHQVRVHTCTLYVQLIHVLVCTPS